MLRCSICAPEQNQSRKYAKRKRFIRNSPESEFTDTQVRLALEELSETGTLYLKPARPGLKTQMIAFETSSRLLTQALNYAAEKVLADAFPSLFHQHGDGNKPGRHAWELWTNDTPQEDIAGYIEQMKGEAEKYLNSY